MNARHVFTCPVCGQGSAQDEDAEDGYCGSCHARTGIPVQLTVGRSSAVIGHLNRQAPDVEAELHRLLHAAADEFEELVAAKFGGQIYL